MCVTVLWCFWRTSCQYVLSPFDTGDGFQRRGWNVCCRKWKTTAYSPVLDTSSSNYSTGYESLWNRKFLLFFFVPHIWLFNYYNENQIVQIPFFTKAKLFHWNWQFFMAGQNWWSLTRIGPINIFWTSCVKCRTLILIKCRTLNIFPELVLADLDSTKLAVRTFLSHSGIWACFEGVMMIHIIIIHEWIYNN